MMVRMGFETTSNDWRVSFGKKDLTCRIKIINVSD